MPVYTDDFRVRLVPKYAPYDGRMPIPSRGIFDEPNACVQINQEWVSRMMGALDTLNQPDVWQGTEVEVAAAMEEIGKLVDALNLNTSCPQSSTGGTEFIFGDCGDCEDCMGGCVLPIGALKVIDGVLNYRTCDGYIPVENWGSIVVDPPPPEEPTEGADYSCNKARGIADNIYTLMQDVIAAIAGAGSVYEMYQPAHNILKNFGSTWETSQGVCAAYVANPSEVGALEADAETPDWLACTWGAALEDTDGLTSSEHYVLQTVHPATFTDAQKLFMLRLVNAVSFTTLQWWARLWADRAGDCDCPLLDPDGETEPTANGWYMSRVYTVRVYDSGNYNTPACLRAQALEDAFGVVFWADWTEPNVWNLKRMSPANGGCSNYDFAAWGDTSDHLEYDAKGTMYGCAATSVLTELLGAGNYTLKTSNYGTITNPATPPLAANQIAGHGFYGDDMEPGAYFEIKMRFIHNTGSPSHQ